MQPSPKSSSQGSLASTSYRQALARLIVGELASYVGDQIMLVATLLLIFQRTGHTSAVGAAAIFLQTAPLLLFGPIGGALADHWPRQRLMIATDVLRAIISLLLLWAPNLLAIYPLLFLLGTGRACFVPALRAFMPEILPPEYLARGNALFSTAFNASLFLGPALGGLVVALWGITGACILNACSFLISAACLWSIRTRPPEKRAAQSSRLSARTVLEGVGVIWQTRRTRGIVLSLIAVVLAGGMVNIAHVGLAEVVFHAGAPGYGALVSGAGLGILAGGLFLSFGPKLTLIDPWLARGISLMLLAITAAALAPTLLLATAAIVFEGMGNAFENTANVTILQMTLPADQQGRAFGSLYTFASLAEIPATALGGILLEFIPARLVYAGAAAIMLLALLIAWITVASPFQWHARSGVPG